MSEHTRDPVHDYRPGPASELPVGEGERVSAVFLTDRRRYWSDHAAMAALGAAVVLLVLPLVGRSGQVWAGIGGVALAVALRGALLASEQFARRWQLTDRRLIGPQGREVRLTDIRTVRRLLSDVQIVTKSGAKHLIKHQADPQAVVARIRSAAGQ